MSWVEMAEVGDIAKPLLGQDATVLSLGKKGALGANETAPSTNISSANQTLCIDDRLAIWKNHNEPVSRRKKQVNYICVHYQKENHLYDVNNQFISFVIICKSV